MSIFKKLLLVFCLLAGIGYFFSAVNININIPNVYNYSMKANLGDLISLVNNTDNSDFRNSVSGSNTKEAINEMLELLDELDLKGLIGGLTTAIVLYISGIPLLVLFTILICLGRFPRVTISLATINLVFCIYTTYQLLRLPNAITLAVNKNLGFLAGFIDLSKAVNINLGGGLLLTLIALICTNAIIWFKYIKTREIF
jgi:hypothetical protein